MPSTPWTPMESLKSYGLILLRKMAFIALGWLLIYLISLPIRRPTDLPVLWLFAPMIGGFAGLVAGWYMATNAEEDSSLSGIVLWVILVIAAVLPMWGVEGILYLIRHRSMEFGGFMEMTAANVMALASAVYHAATQD